MNPFFSLRGESVRVAGSLSRWPLALFAAGLLLLPCLCRSLAADSRVTAVQETLKREQYLFEDPTGTLDDATRAALRRFQIRQGLPPTEEIDAETWRALQGGDAPAADRAGESAPPPAAVAGVPPSTVEADRQFLKQVETSGEKAAAPVEAPAPTHSRPASPAAPVQLAPPEIAVAAPLAPPRERPQPPPPPAPKPQTSRTYESTADFQTSKIPERRRSQVRDSETASAVPPDEDTPPRRLKEPASSETAVVEPQRRSNRVVSASPAEDVGPVYPSDPNPALSAPPGSRVATTTTRTTEPDGRTIVERRTIIYQGRVAPEPDPRRLEPAEPRSREGGFFHRLFHGDHGD
jgi:peptidoglycan hydrolase-like protein with peptidoglycan-binding domain